MVSSTPRYINVLILTPYSPPGLYQCIAQSNLQIRQTSAHVNVRRMSHDYDMSTVTQKYDVVNVRMTVSKAY